MNGKEYLFDLSTDIGEKNDLSETNRTQFDRMKTSFADWLDEMHAAEPRGPFRDF
ncbi:MAG: hypothetical protein GY826_13060 [Fuerstiella sp.]|nr:hypothetical protein [Fuerstiella sp.]